MYKSASGWESEQTWVSLCEVGKMKSLKKEIKIKTENHKDEIHNKNVWL